MSSVEWRLRITATNGPGGWVAVRDLAMAATPGGADLCTGGIAVASSDRGPTYKASNAFDDPTSGSYWSSGDVSVAQPMPQWLEYAFSHGVTVGQYRVQAEGLDAGVPAVDPPKDWAFEYFDGAKWVIADLRINQTGWMGGETRAFIPVPPPVVQYDLGDLLVTRQVVTSLRVV